MNRSLFRTVWLLFVVMILMAIFYFFQNAKNIQTKIYRKNAEIARLKVEKEKVSYIKGLLDELNERTIKEDDTTQLGILRHLNLENQGHTLSVLSKKETNFEGIALSAREIQITTSISYQKSMELLDHLQNTGKFTITRIEMNKAGDYGEKVEMFIVGIMYGLNKNG